MPQAFRIFETQAHSILSATSGFIEEAGFTHSLTPARNCTYGCTYCYVPTMGIYGGLKKEDWLHWGQFTTFKSNAPELLRKQLRPTQVIYCSPLVDPYQPAEEQAAMMPRLLDELLARPPRIFVIQTRGPLILRDLTRLVELSRQTDLRVSFSLTTNREDVRRLYEPRCAPLSERLVAVRTLRSNGIRTFAALAPLLPCDPERLAEAALEATREDVIGDPFHVRAVKRHGATTRDAAARIAEKHDQSAWLDPNFQRETLQRIESFVKHAGRRFAAGTEGFRWLAQ
ncbi:MAG TPA: radical SAM protein [Bryobacteraceae bacterium]|nr:radical SAM protein [Bryobacteraceae bacterium]